MGKVINKFNNYLIALSVNTMNTPMEYIPYTYRIQCKPTGEYYYGVRYAKGCNPDDLWVRYFTSSKAVHGLIKEYGRDSFKIEIRKTFTSAVDAINWESRVNRRTITFNNYLNKNNGHRFSNSSSRKGGNTQALKIKGATWWNNGKRNMRAHECPGTEWVAGYIRGVVRDKQATRIKGIKLSWWNNGTDNMLSANLPAPSWSKGMVSGKNHWWNNGSVQIMSEVRPGPEWSPGFVQSVKDALSVIATRRYNR